MLDVLIDRDRLYSVSMVLFPVFSSAKQCGDDHLMSCVTAGKGLSIQRFLKENTYDGMGEREGRRFNSRRDDAASA